MNLLNKQLESWADGISDEIRFWHIWFATKGGQWPQEYAERMNPRNPLNDLIRKKLQGFVGKARILDVGAGPISIVGYCDREIDFELVPVDALAPVYQRLYAEYGSAPPVPTMFAPAEDLSSFFINQRFDLVHCRNALDHSFDPVRGLEEMLRVVKIGGSIILAHHRNEAESGSYDGFHQYNMDVINGQFVIWNKTEHHAIEELFKNYAEFYSTLANDFVVVEIIKNSEMPATASYERIARRMASVWEGAIHALSHRALSNPSG